MAINHFAAPAPQIPGEAPLIKMRGITKVFHTSAGDFMVLKGIDVDVRQGEFVSVVGRSGSGKSTLVNMLTGIDHPSGGTVQVGDTLLNHMPESRMAVWRGKTLGIVFQFFQLLPMLTVVENVMLPMDFCSMFAPNEREARAMALLRRVGLEDLAHKLPGSISGGQQQSVAVARALANDPPILIADEPTGNLDSRTAEEVIQLFEELVGQGKTILMVTHDRTLARRTSRTLLISDGELVDETVAAAFPDLPHHTLLKIGKMAVPVRLESRETMPTGAQTGGRIFIVSKGQVEWLGPQINGNDPRIGEPLGPAQYLDPQAQPGLTLRAGSEGAELLALDRAEALPLIQPALSPAGRLPLSNGTGKTAQAKPNILQRWFAQQRRTK